MEGQKAQVANKKRFEPEGEDSVREKLRIKRYTVVENTRPISSAVWSQFKLIKDTETEQTIGLVICMRCEALLKYGYGTSGMQRHMGRCKNTFMHARKAPPQAAKMEMKQAIVQVCAEEQRSFKTFSGDAMLNLIQKIVDIGATYGSVNARDLVPHPTSISNSTKDEAQRLRAAEIPRIRDFMAKGACAATTDLWAEEHTQTHYLTLTVHFINNDGKLETHYLFTLPFAENDTADNIKKFLFEKSELLGIRKAELENVKFVTDNGANVKKALQNFVRLYCINHALNVCLRSSFCVKYHQIIEKCVSGHGQSVVKCDEAVRFIKQSNSRADTKEMKNLTKSLKLSKRNTSSYSRMLMSLLSNWNQAQQYLAIKGQESLLDGVDRDLIQEILEFLSPLDFDAEREKSAEVSIAALPKLLEHCKDRTDDAPEILRMKATARQELVLMDLVEQLEKSKTLVAYLKRSGLNSKLSTTVKQETEVRWNSILTLLKSIYVVYDEIAELLPEHEKAKLEAIDKRTLKLLINFLMPFEEETKKLSGESYPTLPLALLSVSRLERHCQQPLLPESDHESQDVKPETEPDAFYILRQRVAQYLETTIELRREHKIGTFLHPTYRKLLMLGSQERNEVIEAVRVLIKDFSPGSFVSSASLPPPVKQSKLDDSYSLWADEQASAEEDEIERYRSDATATSTDNLLNWWKNQGSAYPKLQALARRYLCIPATSTPSERVFSNAGFVINERRTSLNPETVDSTLYLHSYFKLLRNKDNHS